MNGFSLGRTQAFMSYLFTNYEKSFSVCTPPIMIWWGLKICYL